MNSELFSKERVMTSLDKTFCVILPKNFSKIYLFWKFSNFKIEKFEKKEYSHNLIIKILDRDNNTIMETSAIWNSGKIYLNLPKDNLSCYVKIYANTINGKLEEIATSNIIDIPSEKENKVNYGNYKVMIKL